MTLVKICSSAYSANRAKNTFELVGAVLKQLFLIDGIRTHELHCRCYVITFNKNWPCSLINKQNFSSFQLLVMMFVVVLLS